ncbi:hypothetical protein XACM_0903 [Xanthomonas euvesicatoria pv. citrumelo F1]|nr:hypothetical protein XACM_0903 [Xanthomonas euvesicatoria pv. citrumelo F1]
MSSGALGCLRQRTVGRVLLRYRGGAYTCGSTPGLVEGAVPSPLAGHAVNPCLEARWRHRCRQRSRNRPGHRARQFADCLVQEQRHRGSFACCSFERYAPDQRDWSLPAHRRGTPGGMDAAKELTRTYLQRVSRWRAGTGPAANAQRFPCISDGSDGA